MIRHAVATSSLQQEIIEVLHSSSTSVETIQDSVMIMTFDSKPFAHICIRVQVVISLGIIKLGRQTNQNIRVWFAHPKGQFVNFN